MKEPNPTVPWTGWTGYANAAIKELETAIANNDATSLFHLNQAAADVKAAIQTAEEEKL